MLQRCWLMSLSVDTGTRFFSTDATEELGLSAVPGHFVAKEALELGYFLLYRHAEAGKCVARQRVLIFCVCLHDPWKTVCFQACSTLETTPKLDHVCNVRQTRRVRGDPYCLVFVFFATHEGIVIYSGDGIYDCACASVCSHTDVPATPGTPSDDVLARPGTEVSLVSHQQFLALGMCCRPSTRLPCTQKCQCTCDSSSRHNDFSFVVRCRRSSVAESGLLMLP